MQKVIESALRMAVFGVLAAGTIFAASIIEKTDAGRTLTTALPTAGIGSLDTIFGQLDDNVPDTGKSIDLYLIRIVDPFAFSASTVDAPSPRVSDPQLFLFDRFGMAVYMNDDDESGQNGSQSLLPPGHPLGPQSAGRYYLGIGWFDNEPLSAAGRMFETVNATGTNGPDFGAGGGDPLTGWNDDVTSRIDLPTAYEIHLTGAGFATVPEPGTVVSVVLPILAFALRRWRILRAGAGQSRR